MNIDTQALVDTGSVVTLLRPDLAGGKAGNPMEVACIHGDTWVYKTCHVVVRMTHGMFTARAGIVPHLPVPLLIGRDYPIFHRLWNPDQEARSRREPPRRTGRPGRSAFGARLVRTPPPGESSAEEQLVVPRVYVSKVMFMAHTHLQGVLAVQAPLRAKAAGSPRPRQGGLGEPAIPSPDHGGPC